MTPPLSWETLIYVLVDDSVKTTDEVCYFLSSKQHERCAPAVAHIVSETKEYSFVGSGLSFSEKVSRT